MTRAELAFSGLDQDKSGFISTKELKLLSKKMTDREINALMNKVGLNICVKLWWAAQGVMLSLTLYAHLFVQRSFKDGSRKVSECDGGVFQGKLKGALWAMVFQGSFKGISEKYQECFKAGWSFFLGYCQEVSNVFQDSFKSVLRKWEITQLSP